MGAITICLMSIWNTAIGSVSCKLITYVLKFRQLFGQCMCPHVVIFQMTLRRHTLDQSEARCHVRLSNQQTDTLSHRTHRCTHLPFAGVHCKGCHNPHPSTSKFNNTFLHLSFLTYV